MKIQFKEDIEPILESAIDGDKRQINYLIHILNNNYNYHEIYEQIYDYLCLHSTNSNAQNFIGYMILKGLGVICDNNIAFEYFMLSVKKDNMYALNNLGYIYLYGLGVDKDYDKALKLFKKSVQQGYNQAKINIAYMYENGFGVEKDQQYVIELYQELAQNNNPDANYYLGVYYDKLEDVEQSLNYYHRASELLHAKATLCIGLYCENNGDRAKAIEYYEQAMGLGDLDAVYNLAQIYETNSDTKEKAIKLYESLLKFSPSNIVSKAAFKLGFIYENNQDYIHAIKYYGESQTSDSLYRLGYLYELGIGVKKDNKKSIEYYIKAANNNNYEAQYHLAVMYMSGSNLMKQDKNIAFDWFTKCYDNCPVYKKDNVLDILYKLLDDKELISNLLENMKKLKEENKELKTYILEQDS
jgi:TPR repeat protein